MKQKAAGISLFLQDSADQSGGLYSGPGVCPGTMTMVFRYYRGPFAPREVSLTSSERWYGTRRHIYMGESQLVSGPVKERDIVGG